MQRLVPVLLALTNVFVGFSFLGWAGDLFLHNHHLDRQWNLVHGLTENVKVFCLLLAVICAVLLSLYGSVSDFELPSGTPVTPILLNLISVFISFLTFMGVGILGEEYWTSLPMIVIGGLISLGLPVASCFCSRETDDFRVV